MTRRPLRRSEWRRTRTGTWTCSLGERGRRVRLFQKREDGMFYRETHLPGEGRSQAPLGTRERDEAERLGKELLAALLTGKTSMLVAPPPGPVRLGETWEYYRTECALFLDNKAYSKTDATGRATVLIAYFGSNRDVRTLTALDVTYYGKARRAGGIKCPDDRVTPAVRQRSVHADLVLLRAMLRWACTVSAPGFPPDGPRWLDRNPLDGMRFEREKNPVRAVASWERFLATRQALKNLAANAGRKRDQTMWVRLELALVLAEATGRRRGSIVALRWEDIDATAGTIRWRAEYDKKGVESVIPAPPTLLEDLAQFRRTLGALAGPLFPSARDASKPMKPELLTQWLSAAEAKANLPKLPRGLWHPYRRKWASERMHLPLKAVADAGGWKDMATLTTCYQHADEETLLAVMSEPRKRTERRIEGAAAAQPVAQATGPARTG